MTFWIGVLVGVAGALVVGYVVATRLVSRDRGHGVPAALLAPWRKAPLLLFRRVPVLMAVTGATLVLGTAAGATPLFLSSTGSAALIRQLNQSCLADAMPYVTAGGFGGTGGGQVLDPVALTATERTVRSSAARLPHVMSPLETVIGGDLIQVGPGPGGGTASPFAERLVSRTGFLDHVRVLSRGTSGNGVWLTDEAARFLGGVRPGQHVSLSTDSGQLLLPVAGVYRNLERTSPTPFWCAEQTIIYPPGYGALYTPPMLVLVDHATYLTIARKLNLPSIAAWQLPPTSPAMSVATGKAIVAALPAFTNRVMAANVGNSGGLGPPITVHANLPGLVSRAVATARSVGGSIAPAAAAGAAVALLLVAAAGSYWVDRRHVEVRMLAARGVGAWALGFKAALEMGPAALAGGAAGVGAAFALVHGVGPSTVLEAGAVARAAVIAAVAVLVGILLLGTTAGLRARGLTAGPLASARRRWARLVPWELALLGGASYALVRVLHTPATHTDASGVAHANPLVLAFPLLFLVGVLGVLARVSLVVLRTQRAPRRAGPAGYLASRRLAGAPHVALVMLVAAALPVGVLVYSAAVTGSVSTTLHAKVDTFVGSDVAAGLLQIQPVPAGIADHATQVLRSDQQQLGAGLSGVPVDVLGVHRATFAAGAFWTGALGQGRSLASLLSALTPRTGPLPALVAGAGATPSTLELSDQGSTKAVPLQVVDRLTAFPGLRGRPLVVVDADALQRLTHDVGEELWVRGDPTAIAQQFQNVNVVPIYTVDRTKVLDAASFLALTWTFGFLTVIAGLTGAIAIGGLLLYLEARTRSRLAAYVLARRMGLRRRSHLGSVLLEVGSLLGAGLAIGVGLAMWAASLVHGRLDVAPAMPPHALLPLPFAALVAVAAVVAGVCVLAALGAQWSADRATPSEVMRFDG